jgi:putative acetyltransferase
MLTSATLEGPELVPVLLLSPLAVAPARQRQGIGSALVTAVVQRADGQGEPLIVVEGIPAYYPRLGFARARGFGIAPPSPGIADEAFMMRRLSAYRGDLRGRIRYPPAFDESDESVQGS